MQATARHVWPGNGCTSSCAALLSSKRHYYRLVGGQFLVASVSDVIEVSDGENAPVFNVVAVVAVIAICAWM